MAVVEGLAVGSFAVVILLADVGLLALAQSAQRWCHGSSSRNTTGTEKSTDVCPAREKKKQVKNQTSSFHNLPINIKVVDFDIALFLFVANRSLTLP